jgi:uncharacterized DUF497 family protein
MTANELFKQYMAMNYAERTKLLNMFKSLYEADKITSLSAEKKERKEREDYLND